MRNHALDTYLPKLVMAGKRCAICDPIGVPPEEEKPKVVEDVEPIQKPSEESAEKPVASQPVGQEPPVSEPVVENAGSPEQTPPEPVETADFDLFDLL